MVNLKWKYREEDKSASSVSKMATLTRCSTISSLLWTVRDVFRIEKDSSQIKKGEKSYNGCAEFTTSMFKGINLASLTLYLGKVHLHQAAGPYAEGRYDRTYEEWFQARMSDLDHTSPKIVVEVCDQQCISTAVAAEKYRAKRAQEKATCKRKRSRSRPERQQKRRGQE